MIKDTQTHNLRLEVPDQQSVEVPSPPAYRRDPPVHWRLIIWSVLLTLPVVMMLAYGQAIFLPGVSPAPTAPAAPRFVVPSPTAVPEPSATATPNPVVLTFTEPTATLTPPAGGRIVVLTPVAPDLGWVSSNEAGVVAPYTPPNHFGDSYLYAGSRQGQTYYAAMQFDLADVPRGAKIYAANLRLTGLRADQLAGSGTWQVQVLPAHLDYNWAGHSYQQLHRAVPQLTLAPALSPNQLAAGQENIFDFTPEQLALLERRILEGSDNFGKKISFRIDGPSSGNNLFAWDSGYGQASKGAGPELFLSIGPPPAQTPPPYYVEITSTPTPNNVMTAAAISLQMTADAVQQGTATPLPPHWITPVVVTITPTPQNGSTAEVWHALSTAVALTTGEPPNLAIASATPTYLIITSTPTPDNVMTAMAEAVQVTVEAARVGTATPYPANWVTPVVVTATPTPQNTATVAYWRAVALTTGTPTATPGNVQTATATPVMMAVGPLASPTATATPTATPQPIPAVLMGKIIFLSDREGATAEERLRAGKVNATPQVTPQPYVFDPATGQLSRLSDMAPYEVAATREAWSADTRFEAYTQPLLWGSNRNPTIHTYDYLYDTEQIITQMGAGIAYDPAWSPDGRQLAFVSTESGNDEIWVANADGSAVQQLTRNAWEWDKQPSWSPDGESIVFFSNRTGNNQLWIMNKDGSNQRLLMDWNPYNDSYPVWVKQLQPAPALERKLDWRFVKPPEEGQGAE